MKYNNSTFESESEFNIDSFFKKDTDQNGLYQKMSDLY